MSEVNVKKPPTGVIPRKIHDENRFIELQTAINSRLYTDFEIPVEWVQERNELLKIVCK